MSKSLLKLLDYSIFPASIMVLGKLAGVLFSIWFLNIPFTIRDYFSNFYSLRFVVREEDLQAVTSYSDLVMYSIVAIFFSSMIIRAVFFHQTHISPSMIMRLANKNLLKVVQNSYEIYHSATIWLLFLWISNIIILINVLAGNSFSWVGLLVTFSTLFLSVLLIQDVYREVENIRRKPGDYVLS